MPATAAWTRWLAAPIVALSVIGLAACGSGGTTSSSAATGSASPDGRTEPSGMAAFHQCMSEHGITRPARPSGEPGGAGPPPGVQPADGARVGTGAGGTSAPGGHAGGPRGEHHDPTKAPPGVDQNAWTAARAACASLAPTPPAAPGN